MTKMTKKEQRALIKVDKTLNAFGLNSKYNRNSPQSLDGGGEHPLFTRMEWIRVVSEEEVILGYWDWVVEMIDNWKST